VVRKEANHVEAADQADVLLAFHLRLLINIFPAVHFANQEHGFDGGYLFSAGLHTLLTL
jgi:hypothetical protein